MTSREFMAMNKNVFTFVSNFRKIGIGTKLLYVCNPLCTTRTFLTTNFGVRLWVPSVQPTKLLDRFLNDFSPKKTFQRRVFSSQNVNKETSSGKFTYLRNRAFTYSPLY